MLYIVVCRKACSCVENNDILKNRRISIAVRWLLTSMLAQHNYTQLKDIRSSITHILPKKNKTNKNFNL